MTESVLPGSADGVRPNGNGHDPVSIVDHVHRLTAPNMAEYGRPIGERVPPAATQRDLRCLADGQPVAVDLRGHEVPMAATVNVALDARRSRRRLSSGALTLEESATLLRAGAGVRGRGRGYGIRDLPRRFVPSGGGLNSTDVFLFANNVEGVVPGLYLYDGVRDALIEVDVGDPRWMLREQCGTEEWVALAPFVAMLVGRPKRLVWKYETFSYRLLLLDAGVILGTLYLATTALDLAGCAVGGLQQGAMTCALGATAPDALPIALFAAGRPGGEA